MIASTYENWKLNFDPQGNCWLTLDCKDSSTNILGEKVLSEFENILDTFKTQSPKGLVICSAKTNGFIAGANIAEFTEFKSAAEATKVIRHVQQIFDKLEALPLPTVAMINGFCLGGGLEMSLACKYRVALDAPKTKIGLPEILLGVQPGWGGSVRLPRLIGSIQALSLILPGKTVDARTAYKLGIVDAAVPERHFQAAVEYYLNTAPKVRMAGKLEKFIQLRPIRSIVGAFLNKQLKPKVNPKHYPAPYSVVNAWVKNSIYDPQAFVAEAEAIGNLMVTDTARNLVRVFFLRDRLKSFAKAIKFVPKHVHVVGAGVMGGDIAAWCALSGLTVTVQDQNLNAIAATMQRAYQLYNKRLKVPFMVQAACDRLIPDPQGEGVSRAAVIIEAIIENVEAKQKLFAELEKNAQPDAILATNTSTIPLATIGQNLKNPGRVVGIHFFNPVALMQLVEVVSDDNTKQEVVAKALAFVGKIDKLPLPVKSSPGFLVNRILIPYLLESAYIWAEGVPGPAIDKAATDFGMLMGPIELMDTVGLDICIAAAKELGSTIPESVVAMVKSGKLGKKSGEGFYKYKNGKVIKPKIESGAKIPNDIADRIIMRLVNEAGTCLREGIVTDADLVDAGMVFGAGFAPFRGGPMQYAADQKKEQIKQKLDQLANRYGDRFLPDPEWSN